MILLPFSNIFQFYPFEVIKKIFHKMETHLFPNIFLEKKPHQIKNPDEVCTFNKNR